MDDHPLDVLLDHRPRPRAALGERRAEIRQVGRHFPRMHPEQGPSRFGLEDPERTLQPTLFAFEVRKPFADLG